MLNNMLKKLGCLQFLSGRVEHVHNLVLPSLGYIDAGSNDLL